MPMPPSGSNSVNISKEGKQRGSKYSLVNAEIGKGSSFVSNRSGSNQIQTGPLSQSLGGKKTAVQSSSRFASNQANSNSLNMNQQIAVNSKLTHNQKNYMTNADRRPMLNGI